MLYPLHLRELDLVSPAEGKLPLPGTGPLITSDMWLLKLQCVGPSDLRSRQESEGAGVKSAVPELRGRAGQQRAGPGAGSAACRLSWGEGRNPTTSHTEGETEANSTRQVGLAWESAVLSLLPAGLSFPICP